jgi:hypothetical protein
VVGLAVPLGGAAAEPLTARAVASAPLPGGESGRVDPVDDGESTPRTIGRGLLFVPRWAIDVVLFPLRGSLWLSERHRVGDHGSGSSHHARVVPTFSFDTARGFTAGAALAHDDLLGGRERLFLQAAIGSHLRQGYAAAVSTGDRLGPAFALELDASHERRPHEAFYGIGNGDPVAQVAAPIDPRVDPTAVETHYRERRSRVRVTGELRALDHLQLRPSGELATISFGLGDARTPITASYAPDGLVGFDGIQYGYTELELRWDDRRTVDVMEPRSLPTAGRLAAVFGGRVDRLDRGPAFYRYGADVTQFFRVARGPRVVIAALHGEGVTGRRDEVPFSELPRLGGPRSLHGYDLDQFRDRIAASGSLTYKWDLSQWVSASLFTDVGRVYPSLSALSFADLRVGYGLALEGHSVTHGVLELSIASSIDGGVFLDLAFDPVTELERSARRR